MATDSTELGAVNPTGGDEHCEVQRRQTGQRMTEDRSNRRLLCMSPGPLRRLVDEKAEEVRAIASRHRARSIALFGSVARGEEDPASDLDFLVEFEPGSSLFDLLHLQDDLEALFGRRVDVVSAGGLKDRDAHIRREAVPV